MDSYVNPHSKAPGAAIVHILERRLWIFDTPTVDLVRETAASERIFFPFFVLTPVFISPSLFSLFPASTKHEVGHSAEAERDKSFGPFSLTRAPLSLPVGRTALDTCFYICPKYRLQARW